MVADCLGYKAITWVSLDGEKRTIYHVDTILTVGEDWAMFCEESVVDQKDVRRIRNSLEETGHQVITVTMEQTYQFACNSYEATNDDGERFLIISKTGADSLSEEQVEILEKHVKILPVPLSTIQYYGGGSARCMSGDIKLPKKFV